jgi:indolepyruvate ferredoxin oxidoreductase
MNNYSLDDKYLLENGTAYMTGIQALVRLPLEFVRRDRRAGLNSGAFISGYEGSPLGGYDLALNRIKPILRDHNVHFLPGLNEELAATAVLGSQMSDVLGGRNVDGVLGIWYGKGPGVDRSGDVLRHANIAGTGPGCAAIVLAGDDHASKSSTIPHQSDWSLYNVGIPVFYPGSTQEILDFGLLAAALSRFSGAWVGMKLVTNICDGGGTVRLDPTRPEIRLPEGYTKKHDPRLVPPLTLALEMEVNKRRLDAAQEFARLNGVNRSFGAGDGATFGIASAGKSFYDLMQAFGDLGIGRDDLARMRIRIAQFGMTFPLERGFAREFASGLQTLLVVEEKRSFLEMQLRDALYLLPERPAITGKEDEHGNMLLPPAGEYDADLLSKLLVRLLKDRMTGSAWKSRIAMLDAAGLRPSMNTPHRRPNYCSGCPHNRSTLLLEGQVAGGGIGCHGMGIMLNDSSRGFQFATQMGGEGMPWVGMSPFVARKHIFQNIGDGSFAHSGQLAVNAAIAAGVNMTFKILYNGTVAMTGGQRAEGQLPVPALTRKLEAEGVRKIIVLAEDPGKYEQLEDMSGNSEVRDRNDLLTVLAQLEKVPGVTVIIYDQQCAAEKRRLRSRGKLAEPVKRLVIHEEVCEGCGDCVKQSNCMSLHPVDTELGPKIRIHQSSCNKDYSCALGDCPSFVTVNIKEGTGLKKRVLPALPSVEVPAPRDPVAIPAAGYRILLPGIGGTGVVTINALLSTAAMIDGVNAMTLDQTGLAQKGGAVLSHFILSRGPLESSNKINTGNADLILGFDLLGAADSRNLQLASAGRTVAVVNSSEIPTGDSIRARSRIAGGGHLVELVDAATRPGRNLFIDASRLAESLFGSHMPANLFLLGVAWQAGLIPLSGAAITESIRLNGVEVDRNLNVFLWGRKYYLDAAWVESQIAKTQVAAAPVSFYDKLVAYQNKAYADKFQAFVDRVDPSLKDAVARNLYKLMANKDEYEVARLLTSTQFESNLRNEWDSVESIEFNLHPPMLRAMGVKKKISIGPFLLRLLASMKSVRGTALDVFGYAALRKEERGLVDWYCGIVKDAQSRLNAETLPLAIEIARIPEEIRGYEQIRKKSIDEAMSLAKQKLDAMSLTNAGQTRNS